MRAGSLEYLGGDTVGGSAPLAVELFKGPGGLGFTLVTDPEGAVRVHSISEHGAAAVSELRLDDRLLAVNNIALQNLPLDTVVTILKSTQEGPLTLLVARDAPQLALTMGSSSPKGSPIKAASPGPSAPTSPTKSRLNKQSSSFTVTAGVGDTVVVYLQGQTGQPLGLQFGGGQKVPGGYTPLFVAAVLPDSLASQEGQILEGDEVVAINGRNVLQTPRASAEKWLRQAEQQESLFSIVLKRAAGDNGAAPLISNRSQSTNGNAAVLPSPLASPTKAHRWQSPPKSVTTARSVELSRRGAGATQYVYEVVLAPAGAEPLGLHLAAASVTPLLPRGGVSVAAVDPDGPAARAPQLQLGDSLLAVNDTSVVGLDVNTALELLDAAAGKATRLVLASTSFPAAPMPIVAGAGAARVAGASELVFSVQLHVPADSSGLGIIVGGGLETNNALYVNFLLRGGVAEQDGRIRAGDQLLAVDDINLEGATYVAAVAALMRVQEHVTLVLQRGAPLPNNLGGKPQTVRLEAKHRPLGVTLVQGQWAVRDTGGTTEAFYIGQLDPHGAAHMSGRLRVGDIVLEVNGMSLAGMDLQFANQLMATPASKHEVVFRPVEVHAVGVRPALTAAASSTPGLQAARRVVMQRSEAGFGLRVTDFLHYAPELVGLFVDRVTPGGGASRAGIERGDQILAVNGVSVASSDYRAATAMIREATDSVELLVRSVGQLPRISQYSNGSTRPAASSRPPSYARSDNYAVVIEDSVAVLDESNLEAPASPTAPLPLPPPAAPQPTVAPKPAVAPKPSVAPKPAVAPKPGVAPKPKNDQASMVQSPTLAQPMLGHQKPGASSLAHHVTEASNKTTAANAAAVPLPKFNMPPPPPPMQPPPMQPPPESPPSVPVSPPSVLPSPPSSALPPPPPSMSGGSKGSEASGAASPTVARPTPRPRASVGAVTTPVVTAPAGPSAPKVFETTIVRDTQGLGFSVQGGSDTPDKGVFVGAVASGGPSDGVLQVGDQLLAANAQPLLHTTHRETVQVLKAAKTQLHLIVFRGHGSSQARHADISHFLVSFTKSTKALGISVFGGTDTAQEGVFVKLVHKDSPARAEGLQRSDQLLMANQQSLMHVTHSEAVDVLRQTPPQVTFLVQRNMALMAHLNQEGDGAGAAPTPKRPPPLQLSTFAPEDPVASAQPPQPPPPAQPPQAQPPEEADAGEASIFEAAAAVSAEPPGPTTVELVKGAGGLGFFVVTKRLGSSTKIIIKHLAPGGMAQIDGRLHRGDEIVSVNGRPLAGVTQDEAVNILRDIPVNSTATLVILPAEALRASLERTSSLSSSQAPSPRFLSPGARSEYAPKLPRPRLSSFSVLDPRMKATVLDKVNNSLGVSIQGGSDTPLGSIFVLDVLPDGAAAIDGRLRSGYELVSINGRSLEGLTFADAVQVIKEAVSPVTIKYYERDSLTH